MKLTKKQLREMIRESLKEDYASMDSRADEMRSELSTKFDELEPDIFVLSNIQDALDGLERIAQKIQYFPEYDEELKDLQKRLSKFKRFVEEYI